MHEATSHNAADNIAPPRLRADAQANRDRLLEAAREAFATGGIDVPLSAIARRAGVGAATLYRRFPSRADLVAEVFADQLAECAGVLDEALADPDAWNGMCRLITTVCAMQVRDRGFSAAFLARYPDADNIEETRGQGEQKLMKLVRNAKASGTLRPDFDHTDVFLLVLANDRVAAQPPHAARAASRRLVSYFLQAARAGHHPPLSPPAPLRLADLHHG